MLTVKVTRGVAVVSTIEVIRGVVAVLTVEVTRGAAAVLAVKVTRGAARHRLVLHAPRRRKNAIAAATAICGK